MKLGTRKLFNIVAINGLSPIPGETIFMLHIANKNLTFNVNAAQLIQDYNLNDFNSYQADLIRYAASGNLIEFLKQTDKVSIFKIVSKKLDKESQEYLFTLENSKKQTIVRSAKEIVRQKSILLNLDWQDVYEVSYINGMETILKEKSALLLAKNSK